MSMVPNDPRLQPQYQQPQQPPMPLATESRPSVGWGDTPSAHFVNLLSQIPLRTVAHTVAPSIVRPSGQPQQQPSRSFRDVAYFVLPSIVKSSKAATPTSMTTTQGGIDPKVAGLLSQLGITGTDATNLTQQLQRSQYISQLPKEYQPLVQQHFAEQDAKKVEAANNQPFIDPLQMQAFFAQTIQPYLGEQAERIGNNINSVYDTVQQNIPKSDPLIAGLMNQILPQQRAAALAQHQSNVQSFAPSLYAQSVMQQLAKSQQAQEQYSATIRNQAATNALSALGGPFAAQGG